MSRLEELRTAWYDINALQKAATLLSWDQQVLMPSGASKARSEHLARLNRLVHEKITADSFVKLAQESARELGASHADYPIARAALREIQVRKDLPSELVDRKSRASSDAYLAWRQARASSDFAILAPYLVELFDIAKETAERRGFGEHLYDPLIDLFEEGATHAQAKAMFDAIRKPIKDLIQAQMDRGNEDDSFLVGDWNQESLRSWAEATTGSIGFDYVRGRLDVTSNAFCTNLSRTDVRMTTRPKDHVGGIIFSSLHEMGHGLYEQGSPPEWDRTPAAGGISMAVHESQSRLWENIVGRCLPFWQHFLPSLPIAGCTPEEFYRAINRVEPGAIRIGSDELSYNLHILVRFELECEVISGAVPVSQLNHAWNAKYKDVLGYEPKNDGEGVLQDVHWSRGSMGYFPTYSMGNMNSWQIWEALQVDLPNTDALIANGEFGPILGWLQERIYSQAKRYLPDELIRRITGRPMSADSYLRGMQAKYPL